MWGTTDKASGCSVPEAPFHSVSTAILSWVHKVWSSCIPIVSFNQPLLDNWGKLRPRGSRSHFPLAGELRITFIHFILSNIFKHFIGCQAPRDGEMKDTLSASVPRVSTAQDVCLNLGPADELCNAATSTCGLCSLPECSLPWAEPRTQEALLEGSGPTFSKEVCSRLLQTRDYDKFSVSNCGHLEANPSPH